MLSRKVLAAFVASAALAVGAQIPLKQLACGSCHVAEAKSQPETSMAHALQLPADDPLFEKRPALTVSLGAYSYTIERRNGGLIYSVTDGNDTISVPIRWVFGVGSQTFVLQREGTLYESFVSYYPAIGGLDTTMGDQRVHPANLLQAMGRALSPQEAQGCFGCHTTGAVAGHELHLDSMQPGVRCEHCHVGASHHLEAISHGRLDSFPPKLKQLSPEDLSNFCGQCHRSWETVVKGHLFGPVNARFQPYRLATSKCFDGVDPRMSCLACHNPHQEIVRDDTTYDAKCLACHSAGAKPSAGMRAANAAEHSVGLSDARMRTCPVSKTECVSCHMPKVQLPGGHMIFTDHDIRVVHAGEPYPN
ncbi:MAG TPA: multiheme c-type cytochrome [Bryobacteraceae bacterium]|nr:multiheme c-type cytochrome [Bryobacteraceae bacterium]